MDYCRTLVAMLVALIQFGTSHAQQSLVSPQEIQATWVGKTVVGATAAGAPVLLNLQADGTATVQAGKTSDSGTWRLSETGYCATWKTIRAGTERCLTIQRNGNQWQVLNPDGSINSVVTEIK